MGPSVSAVRPEQPDQAQIDRWIADGGIVVAASDRAARAAQLAFHRRRRAEGATAWAVPPIRSWGAFVSASWEQHACDERLILNSAQELELWTGIIGRENYVVTALEEPRRRMAQQAIDAHALLCAYAARFLDPKARSAWDRDAEAFSTWLAAFDAACAKGSLVSASRVPLNLAPILQRASGTRPPVLLVGFDRLLPIHKALFDAWGTWKQLEPGQKPSSLYYYAARDEESELASCIAWCAQQLALQPEARILVISQELADRRGEIERAFLRATLPGPSPRFEFSLGVPLIRIPLAGAAFLFLRWLDQPLTETELDWLFSTGYLTSGAHESIALQSHMRTLRRRNLARPDWALDAFLRSGSLPQDWTRGIAHANRLLTAARARTRTPLEWAALVPDLLKAVGLPSGHVLSSAEFQAWQRLEYTLDLAASLGFDGRRIPWADFLASLQRVVETTLFAPESAEAPIQIVGPEESAGLTADGIWFLGADEDSWPANGSAHPLLPLALQREYGMPHASPRLDADLAISITRRIATSAHTVHLSYASMREESEARPSRIVTAQTGPAHPLPDQLNVRDRPVPLAIPFDDTLRVPFASDTVSGGSAVLTAQSQCAFKAFAIARLGAKPWEPAEFGLSTSQRGLLLHEVMHAIWAGPPDGFQSLHDLLSCPDRPAFVSKHVDHALQTKLNDELRLRMPHAYLALEATRLKRVVAEWLDYEATRHSFTVAQTESESVVSIAGLSLHLRLDRADLLNDGSLLVIDYKTGNVSPRDWDMPRPADLQLPLYAGFACNTNPGGLVFAKLRANRSEFSGRAVDAIATLLSSLSGASALVKRPLTSEQLAAWRDYIEQLARDFLAGRADLDPRDYPRTCDDCGLHAVCRIHENWLAPEPEDEPEEQPID